MKRDPEVSEEMEKSFKDLLLEEVKLREAEALENQQRADMALLEAKKMASQYQKDADKCSSGMETCEEAREKAEATLEAQKALTAMWELRARRRGWKEQSSWAPCLNLKDITELYIYAMWDGILIHDVGSLCPLSIRNLLAIFVLIMSMAFDLFIHSFIIVYFVNFVVNF